MDDDNNAIPPEDSPQHEPGDDMQALEHLARMLANLCPVCKGTAYIPIRLYTEGKYRGFLMRACPLCHNDSRHIASIPKLIR